MVHDFESMLIGLLLEVSEDLLLMELFVAIFKLLLLSFVGGALRICIVLICFFES